MTRLVHLLGALEHGSADDQPLDLRRSFVDLIDFGVAHQFLDWVVGVEAVTTVDLHGIACNFIGDVSSVALADGRHV